MFFLLKPAPFCTLFAGLSSTIKSAISLLLVFDSRSVLATLSSPPSFLLSQTLWQIWQELSSLSSCSIRVQWFPGHSFLPGNDAAEELARRGALLVLSAINVIKSAHSLATLCLFTTSGPDPRELPGFWGSMVFHHTPIPRKGSNNQQQQQHLGVLQHGIQLWSSTYQFLFLAFDEEVTSEEQDNLIKELHALRYPETIEDSFAVNSSFYGSSDLSAATSTVIRTKSSAGWDGKTLTNARCAACACVRVCACVH